MVCPIGSAQTHLFLLLPHLLPIHVSYRVLPPAAPHFQAAGFPYQALPSSLVNSGGLPPPGWSLPLLACPGARASGSTVGTAGAAGGMRAGGRGGSSEQMLAVLRICTFVTAGGWQMWLISS